MSKLQFNRDTRTWVESKEEESPYQKYERTKWREIEDHLWAGVLMGVGLGGFLYTLILGIAYIAK